MVSKLCDFIQSNTNWRELLADKNIKVKEDNNLAIFNYDIDADFSDPIVQEARGIIIDLTELKVVSWPFRKFGNYSESYVDTIDWSSAEVQDKVDGSIIKLWFYDNKWNWSTNSTIYAKDANANTIHSFQDLILKATNYKDIKFDQLNKDYTYIFELVSPENQIVVKYEDYKLYHLGTRNNITGQELKVDIGIEKPKTYPLHSFEDCLEAAKNLNKDDSVQYEGFVVVDKDFHRIKIKSPEYIALHHMIDNGNFSKKRCIELIVSNSDIDKIIKDFPQYEHVFRYYQYEVSEFYFDVDNFISITRNLYAEYSYERKAVANVIKNHRLATFGFKALNNDKTAKDIVDTSKIENYIEDYKPKNLVKELAERKLYEI